MSYIIIFIFGFGLGALIAVLSIAAVFIVESEHDDFGDIGDLVFEVKLNEIDRYDEHTMYGLYRKLDV